MTTKNPNKSPKNKLIPIKDISKSLLLIKWDKNPTFNLNIPPLLTCKDEKNINNDNSNNKLITYQRNIKTKDDTLNMTINGILDKLEKDRKRNKEVINKFDKINSSLDRNIGVDNSCNKIVEYKRGNKKSIDDFFTNILESNNRLENESSLFRYNSTKP